MDEDEAQSVNWYTAEAYPDPVVRRNLLRHEPPDPNETAEERMARGWRILNARVHYRREAGQLADYQCRPDFAR